MTIIKPLWSLLRRFTPDFLRSIYTKAKKQRVRKALDDEAKSGKGLTKDQLIDQLKDIGLVTGDVVLVHASFSKIGFVEGGPITLIEALIEVIGQTGHILMPSSPNGGLQLEYIRQLNCFDVLNEPSKLGVLSGTFRTFPGVIRSASPTEPVCCLGPDAEAFIKGHEGQMTPYNTNSPFYKVAKQKGKILYIGVTLDNAGTSLHVLEDVCDTFDLPIYFPTSFKYTVKLHSGEVKEYETLVHDPLWSAKRRCDGLIPLFEQKGVLEHRKLGRANVLVMDAEKMLSVMIDQYNSNKTTMYFPNGE